jgi:pentatricopeptide repeat protein
MRLLTPQTQRRTFFSFFKPGRKAKSAELLEGLETMSEVAAAQRTHDRRLPPPQDVAKAFNSFFKQRGLRLEDFHVTVAQIAFKYLQEQIREGETPWSFYVDIIAALRSLKKPPETGGKSHLAFAKLLNDELAKKQEALKSVESSSGKPGRAEKSQAPNQPLYLEILCQYGATLEARDLAVNLWTPRQAGLSHVTKVWTIILSGFAREKNSSELLRTLELMQELEIPFQAEMQDIAVSFLADSGDLEQAKHWYSQPVTGPEQSEDVGPKENAHAAILKACAMNGDLAYGQQVVASMLKEMPEKPQWDAIFVWSAAIGKGVDEIGRMMDVMIRRSREAQEQNPSRPIIQPDVDTINALVDFAVSKQDPYLAERFIALAEKRGIPLDTKTFAMQMQYRLAANDIDGARSSYFGLQGAKDEHSVAVTNQLIRAMCQSKQQQFDDIMAIVDDLHEQKAWFSPETVASLASLHLRRGEVLDARDILQVHAHKYSPQQRRVIRDYLVDFLLDRQNSTADAWDTYQVLRQLFPETPRAVRIRLMNEFFDRGRSDMGCHVFFHMRNHTHEEIRADRDVYVAAFAGFSRTADKESLELAHNQLKLDLNVEPDTKLRNALMLAYAATGNQRVAMDFWTEIVASKEGPSYESIVIAFRVCEGMPWGDRHAKGLWLKLKRMEVEIDRKVFTGYLCALAGNYVHEDCVKLLETVEEEYGFAPDLDM